MPTYEVAYTLSVDVYVDVELEAANADEALDRAREYQHTDEGYQHLLEVAEDKLGSIELDGVIFQLESIDGRTVRSK